MTDIESSAGSRSAEGPTSSGVQALLDRLRQQGVEAGRTAKVTIVAEAEDEAERIVKEAREKATAIVEEAVADAERLRASGFRHQ